MNRCAINFKGFIWVGQRSWSHMLDNLVTWETNTIHNGEGQMNMEGRGA